MPGAPRSRLLNASPDIRGTWVHSHEEDEGDRVVLRPPSYAFPPSRGRASLSLEPGGAIAVRHPGPDDRTVASDGEWSLDGNRLSIVAPWLAGEYDVESADADALVLRKR